MCNFCVYVLAFILVRFYHLEDSGTGKFANDGLSMFSLRFSIMFQLCFKYGFTIMENHEIIHSKFQKACSLFFSFARPSKKTEAHHNLSGDHNKNEIHIHSDNADLKFVSSKQRLSIQTT